MAWVRLDDQFFQHPKVLKISNQAFRLYINSLCYSSVYNTDGKIIKQVCSNLLSGIYKPSRDEWTPEQCVQELIEAELWDVLEDSYCVHDYLDYNFSKENREKLSDLRKKSGSKGGVARAKQIATILLQQKRSKRLANVKQNSSRSQTHTHTQTQRENKEHTHTVGSQNEPTMFVSLWKNYPEPKGSRQEALKAFLDVRPPDNVVELLAVQVAHKARCDSQGLFWPHMPHCVRWLKHRRWTDEIPSNGSGTHALPADPKRAWKDQASYLAALQAGRVSPKLRVPEWETSLASRVASAENPSKPPDGAVTVKPGPST